MATHTSSPWRYLSAAATVAAAVLLPLAVRTHIEVNLTSVALTLVVAVLLPALRGNTGLPGWVVPGSTPDLRKEERGLPWHSC